MKQYIYIGIIGIATLTSCKKPRPIYTEPNANSKVLTEQLKQFAPEAEITTINSDKIIRIETAKGNVVVFPKRSFALKGTPVTGNVEVSITEMTTKSEMIFADLMTNSDEGPLESRGEFIVKVSQNGVDLELADGVDFTIENPNVPNSPGMRSWYWNANSSAGTGVQNGEWTAGTDLISDPCDLLTELKSDLFSLDPLTQTQEVSTLLNAISSLVYSKSVSDGNNDQLVLYLDNYVFNSNTDSWSFSDSTQTISTSIYGNKDQHWNVVDTTINDFYTSTGTVYFGLGCSYDIFIGNNTVGTVNLDPNVITVKFNQLNYCNIDALIGQFGGSYNCEIIIDQAPLTASVHFIFPDLNGVLSCTSIKDGEFSIDRLPSGMPIQVVVYYKDGDNIKFGTETITASENMVFDTSKIITLNGIDELVKEIEKFD